MGGLAHRHSFLKEQREKHAHVTLVDNGNLAHEADKAEVVMAAMARDGYDAVGLGPLDAALGAAYTTAARRHRLPLVRAPVPAAPPTHPPSLAPLLPSRVRRGELREKGPGDEGDRLPLRTTQIGHHTVGITALAAPGPGRDAGALLDRAVASTRALRAQCDLLVLLSQMGLAQDQELARQCGEEGPDLIVGNLQARKLQEPLRIGRSVLLPAGPGGEEVGVARVALPRWGRPHLVAARVMRADGAGRPNPEVDRMVQEYYRREQAEFTAGVEPALLAPTTRPAAGDARRCGRCHPRHVATWRRTRHSRAVDTLLRETRLIPECLVCHSSRYREHDVFDYWARAGGVDCTGCHAGAGSSRCTDGAARTGGEHACRVCHTAQHSPRFGYADCLSFVDHRPQPTPPTD